MFQEKGLETHFAEEYYSVSKKGVLRGLHFQLPPYDHNKLVYCINGHILDVLIDLRTDSPCYGKAFSFDLSEDRANMLYISKGIAHGFYVLSETAMIVCQTSRVYSSDHDKGISWKSINLWPTDNPILSEKDKNLPLLNNFVSPFKMEKK